MTLITTITVLILFAQLSALASDSLSVLCVLHGQESGEHYGLSMAGVGDVDGDGLADFLVGDTRDGWHVRERRCHLYLGTDILDAVPSMIIHQSESDTLEPQSDDDARFGAAVAGGHDVNRDGYDDMVITSPDWFAGTGKIYLYLGGSPPHDLPAVAIAGFGSSWMTLFWATGLRGRLMEDVNGDGYDELVCVVYPLGLDGGAYVYFGGAPMDSVHDIGLRGPGYPDIDLGASFSHGDLNGDESVDIAVGSFGGNGVGEVDCAWAYFGSANFDETADVALRAIDAANPYSVRIVGDLNGDGYDDAATAPGELVAILPENHKERDECDQVNVYFGDPRMDGEVDLKLSGRVDGMQFSLAGGDVNIDGLADLIVGEEAVGSGEEGGRMAVYFGRAEMDTVPDLEVYGPGQYGKRLTWIGDMTGDGWPEFAVANPQGAGEIYVYTMGEVSGEGPQPNVTNLADLRVIPNPTTGPTVLYISGGTTETVSVGLYDHGGRRLTRLNVPGSRRIGTGGIRVDWSWLKPGVYTVRADVQGRSLARRLIRVR